MIHPCPSSPIANQSTNPVQLTPVDIYSICPHCHLAEISHLLLHGLLPELGCPNFLIIRSERHHSLICISLTLALSASSFFIGLKHVAFRVYSWFSAVLLNVLGGLFFFYQPLKYWCSLGAIPWVSPYSGFFPGRSYFCQQLQLHSHADDHWWPSYHFHNCLVFLSTQWPVSTSNTNMYAPNWTLIFHVPSTSLKPTSSIHIPQRCPSQMLKSSFTSP